VQNNDFESVAILLCLQLDRKGRDKNVELEYAARYFNGD